MTGVLEYVLLWVIQVLKLKSPSSAGACRVPLVIDIQSLDSIRGEGRKWWTRFGTSIYQTLKLKLQYFDHLMRRTDSLEKTLMLGKIEGRRRRGDDRGWHSWMASPVGRTWVWASSRSWWWTGKLACCSPWGRRVRHDWATGRNWVKLLGNGAHSLCRLFSVPDLRKYFLENCGSKLQHISSAFVIIACF